MDFSLTEEQQLLNDTLRTMARRQDWKKLAAELDRTSAFPHHLLETFAELGLLGMTISEDHGGGGMSGLDAVLVIEELAKSSSVIAAPVFESCVGPVRVIDLFGTEAQKERYLPRVCRGEISISVGMTEPGAGSDLVSLSSRLTPDGDDFILNGRKTFISGGGEASHYLVYCRFGDVPGAKGIGAVVLKKGTEGFLFGRQEELMGLHGIPSCDLIFSDVRVPKADVVLWPGSFAKLMSVFDLERCGNAAMSLGVAAGAVEIAKAYAAEREAFGRPICEFQAVQFKVVDMAMKLDAARLLVYRAASGAGGGYPSMYESAMGKCYANQMAVEVTNDAMQILGGYGYSREYPVERMHRDALGWRVGGGTAEMLRVTLASVLFARRFNQRREG